MTEPTDGELEGWIQDAGIGATANVDSTRMIVKFAVSGTHHTVDCELSYDVSYPLVVHLAFLDSWGGERLWATERAMMAESMYRTVGEGDIGLGVLGGMYAVQLISPDDDSVTWLSAPVGPILQFINRTCELMPPCVSSGAERRDLAAWVHHLDGCTECLTVQSALNTELIEWGLGTEETDGGVA